MFTDYNRCDIRFSQPKLDCRFIKVFHFRNEDNSLSEHFYAECLNPVLCQGLCSLTIREFPDFGFSAHCKSCKFYDCVHQLSLF